MAHPIRGVIFDVDGTLVDSVEQHTRAWHDALVEHGAAVGVDAIRPLIGMSGDRLLPDLTGIDPASEFGRRIDAWRKRRFLDHYLPQIEPFPKARDLIERLRERDVALVLASSASEEELGPLLERGGVRDLLPADSPARGDEDSKPAPDLVLSALASLGLPAAQVAMIGDTPWDMRAAQGAGVTPIAVRSSGWSAAELVGAAAVYRDVGELYDAFDSSPLGR